MNWTGQVLWSLKGVIVVFVLIALFVPRMSGYELQLITDLMITMIIVSSFRFITLTGRWCFAHVALAGVGGYTSAIFVIDYDVPFAASLFLGGILAAMVALVISVPTLRTNDFYFLMSTFAAAGLIVWTWNRLIHPFGGTSGIYGIPRPAAIGGVDFGSPVGYAYLVAIVAFVSLAMLLRMEGSRLGLILKGIRWQTPVAHSLGVHVRFYETVALMVGSFFAGLAGVLFVHYHSIAFPGSFGTDPTIEMLMFVVVGGAEKYWGPLLGATVLTAIEQGIQQYPTLVPYVPLVFGSLTVLIVLVLPDGLIELPSAVRGYVKRRRRKAEPRAGGSM